MRTLLILFFLVAGGNFCQASTDDSLPKGVSSRFLNFPFLVRSPETSWGVGGASAFFFKAKKNETKLRTSDINLIALYTLQKQTVIVLGSTVFFAGEDEVFRFQSSFSNYPDKTWGLGNNTPENAKEDYALKQFFFNPQILFKLRGNIFFGASFELQKISDFTYINGGVFDEQDITGKSGGLSSGVGLLVTWDTRNNAYSPSHGVFAEINATTFTELIGSDFNFVSYLIDIRKFMPAGLSRVLAFQSITKINVGSTPYRNLSMLGGTDMMRGYFKGRYTDQNMFTIQAELRQYLFWRFGIAGFASAGQVSKYVDNFGLSEFHYAYGAGLRFVVKEREKLNLRIDFGFGKNSNGIYVILKDAF